MEIPEKEPVFRVDINEEGLATIVSPSEVDLYTAPYLIHGMQEALLKPEVQRVVVNLGQTSFLDSSGIHALITLRDSAEALDKPYAVHGVHGSPMKVLRLSGVLDFLNVEGPA